MRENMSLSRIALSIWTDFASSFDLSAEMSSFASSTIFIASSLPSP
jgi:hypothetical protein